MNLWPLCTAKVRPIKSGVIIERRDHVRIIRLSPAAFAASTFFCRWPSTNGPFLSDLAISIPESSRPQSAPLAARPAADDITIRLLLAAGLVALGRHPPRRLGMIAFGTPLAAAVRMVHRVHRDSAHVRALAQPAAAAGLADRNIFMIDVADLSDRRAAF